MKLNTGCVNMARGVFAKKWIVASLFLLSFLIFSCNHNKNTKNKDKPQAENQNNNPTSTLPKLTLDTLLIDNKDAKSGKVTVSKEELIATNITAKFKYGKPEKLEEIAVVIKDAPFKVDKTKEKMMYLSVPEKKDTYQAWNFEVGVTYSKEQEDPQTPEEKDLISALSLSGGAVRGVFTSASLEQVQNILDKKEPTIELSGPVGLLDLRSNKVKWTKCTIDGQEIEPAKFTPAPTSPLKSHAYVALPLGEKESVSEHEVKVEADSKKQSFKFKIKRLSATIDIPSLKLFIVDKDVLTAQNLPKLQDGSKPEFNGTDPCKIGVVCFADAMKNVSIDGTDEAPQSRQLHGKQVWISERSVPVPDHTNGKDVSITIKPKNEADYHETTWLFHLKFQSKQQMSAIYTFNNKPKRLLDKTFTDGLEAGSKPLLTLQNASYLNMKWDIKAKLQEVRVGDDSYTGSALIDNGIGTLFFHSIKVDSTAKDVKITFVPQDIGRYDESTFEFQVKGDANKEELKPILYINSDVAMDDDFVGKAKDGSTNPLHKIAEDIAEIEFYVDEYTYTFMCDKININNADVDIKKEKKGYKNLYVARTSIPVEKTTAKNVVASFVSKLKDSFKPITYKFQVQGGAEKPTLPKEKIFLWVNGKGGGGIGDPLPKEMMDNITEGTYEYVIDTDKVELKVGWYAGTNDIIEHAIFQIDSGAQATVQSQKVSNAFVCTHTFTLPNFQPHDVVIKTVPKADSKYKELVYKFKIKNSGQKPPIPLDIGFDRIERESGKEYESENDMPVIYVIDDNEETVVEELRVDGKVVKMEKIEEPTYNGQTAKYYKAETPVDVNTTNHKEIAIVAKPKNASLYRETTFTLKIKAKKDMPKDNGKFSYNTQNKIDLACDIEWEGNLPDDQHYSDDQGAKTALFEFRTESTHAKVKYKVVFNRLKINASGDTAVEEEIVLQDFVLAKHLGLRHITQKIILPKHIPATVVAEVVPDEGVADPDKGIYSFTFNPAVILWDYATHADHKQYAMPVSTLEDASGEKIIVIKVRKEELEKPENNKKVHLAFGIWKEEFNVAIDSSASLSFSKIDLESDRQWYKAEVDASSLVDSSSKIDISVPIKLNNKVVFTYKFLIKLE